MSRRRRYARWAVLCLGLGVSGMLAATATVIGAYYYVSPSLPQAETIREIPLQIPLRIFSRDGRLIEEVGERRRILVSYEDLPPFVVDAFVSAEDGRFFEHPGIDYQGILRALLLLVKSGEISGGGSTITQQLARDYFLTREQLFTRKLREAFLAWQIEQTFTKEEIMALFLNKMFFGQRAYGVAAAAQVYYGKPLSEINVAEAATLAGVLPAPSEYNPVRSAANAGMRRRYVLNRMHELGHIDEQQLEEALAYPLESRLHGTKNELSAPYVAEMVRREMLDRYGESTYSAGFSVVTTLDSRLQAAANYAVRNGLFEFTRRRGYRGPIDSVEIDPEVLVAPYAVWPEELQRQLQDYGNPAGLSVAIVTALNEEDNSVEIVLQNGTASSIAWHGISWARPYIDRETRGPEPESVTDVLTAGDIIYVMPITIGGWALAQLPTAQSAIVSVDPMDGAITSLVGGLDFSLSKFNRATQSARQPGSSFKPFIYSAALENGNTLATIVPDSPVVISSTALERLWRPVNYSGRFYGDQRVREAMVRSMNLASVRLLLNNTGIGNAVNHLAPFGFNEAALPRNGSLALGGGNASPLDMAQAYATFANGGYAVKPYVIDSIVGPAGEHLYRAEPAVVCPECEPPEESPVATQPDPQYPVHSPGSESVLGLDPKPLDEITINGGSALAFDQPEPLYEQPFDDGKVTLEQMADLGESYQPDATAAPELFKDIKLAKRIISPQNAFLIQDAMREVIQRGTGVRARVLGRTDLSGKTGTSNDRRDAWFAGFNADIASIVWVGYDDDSALGPREEGSRTALPIWIEFARLALKGVPNHRMDTPDGIVSVRISKTTGCPADATTPFEDVMFEHFREDHVPECEVNDVVPDIFNTSDESADIF
ncbi:MAG: transglycosylase domain-containing protein [Gammaproteobacteria bacterium]|nr:transglycosylase domain-containing protein [Gammaproteobacteria bacterium]